MQTGKYMPGTAGVLDSNRKIHLTWRIICIGGMTECSPISLCEQVDDPAENPRKLRFTSLQRCSSCILLLGPIWLLIQDLKSYDMQKHCILHSTNTLGKGMKPIILPPAMGKQQDRLGSLALVRQLVQEKENSEFKSVKLRLKIGFVSYPARAEGQVNRICRYGKYN